MSKANASGIWHEYAAALKQFLQNRVANEADVEDLLHDIFLKVHAKRETLNDQQKLQAWLWQIARHAVIDFYRAKGRSNDLSTQALWYEDESPSIQHSLSLCLAPFIQSLPRESADLLNAIELQGVSQKVYAETHGMAYSTLKSRVKKAREQLKAKFDQCCEFSVGADGQLMDYQSRRQSSCRRCE